MPRITKFLPKPEKERVYIYVDGEYCCSVRERTFHGLGLSVGQSISCDEIKELEIHHWKHKYSKSWDDEKVRLDKVKKLVLSLDPNIIVEVTGFGADSSEFIPEHPDEQGRPDLAIRSARTGETIMCIEVTGTKLMRGNDYWVRPDKLEYTKNHLDLDVWVVLHYAEPEKFVFIKPNPNRHYVAETIRIGNSDERMVIFDDYHPDVKSKQEFVLHLKNLIAASNAS